MEGGREFAANVDRCIFEDEALTLRLRNESRPAMTSDLMAVLYVSGFAIGESIRLSSTVSWTGHQSYCIDSQYSRIGQYY